MSNTTVKIVLNSEPLKVSEDYMRKKSAASLEECPNPAAPAGQGWRGNCSGSEKIKISLKSFVYITFHTSDPHLLPLKPASQEL